MSPLSSLPQLALRCKFVQRMLVLELFGLTELVLGGDLLDRISRLRNKMAQTVGIVMPKVRIRDDMVMAEREFQINVLGTAVRSGTSARTYA